MVRNTYPPVLVPPIKSNTSQGLGGESQSICSIRSLRIYKDDSPRIPPPSKLRNILLVASAVEIDNRKEIGTATHQVTGHEESVLGSWSW
jgi:hypothetical protein